MQRLDRTLLFLSLISAPALAQGTVTPYGCGVNPSGSLALLSGTPSPGETITLGLLDTSGTSSPGSMAALLLSLEPDPSYPCGTPLPGFGLGGPAGELLISLSGPTFSIGTGLMPGPGEPMAFALPLPSGPSTAGAHFYVQGAVIDAAGPGGIGLTDAVDVFVDAVLKPDLAVRAVWIEPIPVAPGEPLEVHTVIENRGGAASPASEVEVCLSNGECLTVQVPALAEGHDGEVITVFVPDASWVDMNPHWPSVTVDPQDLIDEGDEGNGPAGTHKPGFVVNVQLVAPSLEVEHDDVIVIKDGVKVSHDLVTYGPGGAQSGNEEILDPHKPDPSPSSIPEQPRIDPKVIEADAQALPGELIEYLVKVDHGVEMPRLPMLLDTSDRFSKPNVATLTTRMGMFEGVKRARIAAMQEVSAELKQAGGQVLEHFALSGSMLVRAPKGFLQSFDLNPMVQHVESTDFGKLLGDAVDARSLIRSDPYFNGGATGTGFIAIIDSGVRQSHDLLSSPDHIWFVEDCVDGNSSCNDTGDSDYSGFDSDNHGTAVSAIVTANTNYGNSDRGFTSGWIDSWRVTNDSTGSISNTSIHRAFDQAVLWGDHIINCSFGGDAGPSGSVADDADDAFDAGCIVLCANGNDGPGSGTVDSPACAHKALGVGAYDVDSLSDYSSQSDGPTSDGRVKPDLQAPNNIVTARSTSNSAMSSFGGTSGATPCVTGAASVLADWFGLTSMSSSAAGKVYAALINGGPREWSGSSPFNDQRGVGAFELPLNGTLYTGSRNVTRHDSDYVTIDVPSGTSKISAAIWWGENPINIHRDIDLYLLKPSGSTSDSSLDVESVFEHLKVSAPITSGERQVRIYGYSMPTWATVTVYYAIFVQD